MSDRPSAEESAAIAAAYAILRRRTPGAPRPEPSRWALGARLPELDAMQARSLVRAASRWSAAARLDD